MNLLKKYLGIVWLCAGPTIIIIMILQAIDKVGAASAKAIAITNDLKKAAALGEVNNTILQWSIIILVFIPIAIGLMIFGKYSFTGEYTHITKNSGDL